MSQNEGCLCENEAHTKARCSGNQKCGLVSIKIKRFYLMKECGQLVYDFLNRSC